MADQALSIADDFAAVSYEDWRKLIEKELAGAPFASLTSKVDGAVQTEPLYAVGHPAREAGSSGLPLSPRGGDAQGAWTVQQEHDDPRLGVAASLIREDLERGADAILLRCGSNAGVRILTAGDLAVVLGAVDLAKISVCLEPEGDALPVGAAFLALAAHRGVAEGALRGCFGVDPIGALARTGTLEAGLSGTTRAGVDLALYASKVAPGMRTFLASSRPYADGGATAVDELAYLIATGVAYLSAMTEAGLSVDAAASQIHFAVSVGGHFFGQIAKLRALRLLWSKVVAAAGGRADAQRMVLHARTARYTKTERDPWVNMLRGTAESTAAILGGADSVATAPFDECVGASDAFSRRVARNTQLVLREESHLHRVLDPAGGSYYVEALTEQLARAAWEAFRAIEAAGGMERALTLGHIRRTLDATREAREARINKRRDAIVGVSEFPNLDEKPLERAAVDMREVEVELGHPLEDGARGASEQDARVAKVGELALAVSREGALTGLAVEAAALGVDIITLGRVLAEGQASAHVEPIAPYRAAGSFEALRGRSDAQLAKTGSRPAVAVLCLGSVAEHTARVTWLVNALAAGGIEARVLRDLSTPAAATDAFLAADVRVAIVAGPDARYGSEGVEILRALDAAGATRLLVAGKPGEREAALREAGARSFLYVGQDLLASLEDLYRDVGDTER